MTRVTEHEDQISALRELAYDLRWTWSHEADSLWCRMDPSAWERTRNPWTVLQGVTRGRIEELLQDAAFRLEAKKAIAGRKAYLETASARMAATGWRAPMRDGTAVSAAAASRTPRTTARRPGPFAKRSQSVSGGKPIAARQLSGVTPSGPRHICT